MYERTYWVDHVVSPQHLYHVEDNGDGTQTITQAGDVIQEGTPIDQAHLNHMEEGIEEAHRLIDNLSKTVEEGVSSVYTDNGNSFDADGLNVNPDGGEMATKVDKTGVRVQQKESGQEVFAVNGTVVTAKDLSVRGSITLCDKIRLEPYGEDGIGLYVIGG